MNPTNPARGLSRSEEPHESPPLEEGNPPSHGDPTVLWPVWGILVTFPFAVCRSTLRASPNSRWPAAWPEGGVRLGQAVLSPVPPAREGKTGGGSHPAPTLAAGGRAFRVRALFSLDHDLLAPGTAESAVVPLSWLGGEDLPRAVTGAVARWQEQGCPFMGTLNGAVQVYLEAYADLLRLPPLLPR